MSHRCFVAVATAFVLLVGCTDAPDVSTASSSSSTAAPETTAASEPPPSPPASANARGHTKQPASLAALDCRNHPAGCAHGIDLSHYQGDVDWTALRTASDSTGSHSVHFVFVKATEGVDDVDPRFDANWSASRSVGLPRGAYHVFIPTDANVRRQVDHFLATVRASSASNDTARPYDGELPVALDVEQALAGRDLSDGSLPPDTLRARIQRWLTQVESQTHQTPLLYSSAGFIERHIDGSSLDVYPTWVARYGAAPGASQAWQFWQYSQRGSVPGIDGAVDRSLYNGSVEALHARSPNTSE